MSDLSGHQKNLQVLSDLIRFTLGVDVFFVDQCMMALAGTGPYRPNIGTKRPRDSYVDVTLHHGDSQVVTQPRYTRQCYRCEYRDLCPYSMVMCWPIAKGERIKGLIGFLGFSEEQRKVMIERSSLLMQLSRKLDYVWDAEGLDVKQFLTHAGTRRFLDAFDEGLLLTSPQQEPWTMNQRAEHLIASGGMKLQRKARKSAFAERPPLHLTNQMTDQNPGYLISDGDSPAGRLFVFVNHKKSGQFWSDCPLSVPKITTIVGTSTAMAALKQQAVCVAEGDSTILLIGETGAGKELVAQFIHQSSPRWSGPFETINCAAIPDTLFESEVFGYAPGAFTGADKKGRTGTFHAAHKGTLFLDEVGRLSLTNQTKILRILEERQVQRLGDNRKMDVDVRVIAATNVDLDKAVSENQFLPDLYYRLMVIPLVVPPLKDRTEDIPLLIEYFILQLRKTIPNPDFLGFTKKTVHHLQNYSWPGNVRELKNMVEYAMNLVRGRPVEIEDLPPTIRKFEEAKPQHEETLAQTEQERIRKTLEIFGHSTKGKKQVAKALGISLSTLYRRMARITTTPMK